MKTVLYTDAKKLLEDFGTVLLKHEAENSVCIVVLETIKSNPDRYPERYMCGIFDNDGTPLGVAWLTPPFALGMSDLPSNAISCVIDFARSLPCKIPGIFAPAGLVKDFISEFEKQNKIQIKEEKNQRTFKLEKVIPPTGVHGKAKLATESDKELLYDWGQRFYQDCGFHQISFEQVKVATDFSIKMRNRWFWLDLQNNIVSMAGLTGETPTGCRIAWVYTPPEYRGQGYASALVAFVSQVQLDAGKKFCFLDTDLANPTSNSIYQKIGYKAVSDTQNITFDY